MNFLSIYVFQSLGAGCEIQKPTAHFQHLIQPSKPTVRVCDLPKSFDWSDVNNTNMVTPAKTQFLPHPCGSCWAFGATGALSDRIKIATKGRVPDMVASVQVLLNAGRTADGDLAAGSWGDISCIFVSCLFFCQFCAFCSHSYIKGQEIEAHE